MGLSDQQLDSLITKYNLKPSGTSPQGSDIVSKKAGLSGQAFLDSLDNPTTSAPQENIVTKVGNSIAGNQTPDSGDFFDVKKSDVSHGDLTVPLKTVANVVPDFVRTTAGLPAQTAGLVGKAGEELKGLVKDSGGIFGAIKNLMSAINDPHVYLDTLKAVIPSAAQKAVQGDFDGAAQDIANHPFQQIAPFLMVLEKGASGFDKTTGGGKVPAGSPEGTPPKFSAVKTLDTGVKAITEPIIKAGGVVAEPIANVVKNTVKGSANLANKLASYGTSQATGLSPETIHRIISNPEDFSPAAMKEFTREGVAAKAFGDVNTRLQDLADTGKEYGKVREANTPVNITKGTVEDVLGKHNISVSDEGKLIFTKESTPTSQGDQTALQHWYDTYGKEAEHSSNSFLNTRKGLDNLAQWDSSKTDAANRIAMDLRHAINEVGRPQVPGLEELDKQFSAEIQDLKQVKKDYFNSDGTLKDNAIGKIANLSNKGRDTVLARLEKVSPGIGEKVRTLKAVEDIHAASGQKVGAYARAVVPGAAGFAMGGPFGAVVAAILSSPEVATQVLRGYGKMMGLKDATISKIVGDYEQSSPKSPPTNLPKKENPTIDNNSTISSSIPQNSENVKIPKGKAGTAEVPVVSHGTTSPDALTDIKTNGFRASKRGIFGEGVYFTNGEGTLDTYGKDNTIQADPSQFKLKNFKNAKEQLEFIRKQGFDKMGETANAVKKEGQYDGFIVPNADKSVGDTHIFTNLDKLNKIIKE